MKIPHPWPYHPHTRFNALNADSNTIGTAPAGPEIEVPNCVEVLLEPIKFGRSDAPAVAPGKIWSEKWGLQDIADHVKKVELEQETAQLKADLAAKAEADKAAEADRKAAAEKEAAEKIEAIPIEKALDAEQEARDSDEVAEAAKAEPVGVDDDEADLGDNLKL